MNDASQPNPLMISATTGMESAEPTREPLSKILVANARCAGLNHCATSFAQAGYAPASPTPSIRRQPNMPATLVAAAVSAVNTDHQPTASGNAMRAPTLSTNHPNGICINEQDQKKPLITRPICAG